jgi:hypothetical protein
MAKVKITVFLREVARFFIGKITQPRLRNFETIYGARTRVGIGWSYRPARLHMLADLIPWESILGLLKTP